ncbi:MAG: exonuclease domain-containing protein [Firmicutes bacterium]|nr:exonuclease domain-containing protein [Bacillota bacterium]MBQ9604304.1 exonuclease domain-containing protein [Bacillota bacterium]
MYTVIDLEFNQAFDFGEKHIEPNPACRFEIIQIGAVTLDENLNETGRFSSFINPQIYTRLHPYVAKMTGITSDELKKAPYFDEVYKNFAEFSQNSGIYCVWGNSDIRALYRNLCYHGIVTGDVLVEFIDVQQVTAKYLKYGRGKNVGLKNAMELLEIDIDIPFHNALSDAIYTAKAMKKVYKGGGVRVFNSKHIPKREDSRNKNQ